MDQGESKQQEMTMIGKRFSPIVWGCALLLGVATLSGQWWPETFNTNEKIEAEDMEYNSISGTDKLVIGNGIGWIPHPDSTNIDSTYDGPWYPSEFAYARCGNRHWLCDADVVEWCNGYCADEYLSADVDIPEDGYYLVYSYVACWSDSAVLVSNRGCDHGAKWEASAWNVNWDDIDAMDKVLDGGGELNVPRDFIYKIFPYDLYCGAFNLDTVIIGHDRSECPLSDPRSPCDFESAQFYLTAGTHTLYFKVSEEFALLDWIYVAKVGDPPPPVEPGAPFEEPVSGIAEEQTGTPQQFKLRQNYPNPFNANTVIRYTIPWKAAVSLTIHDIIGQEVAVLVNAEQSAGNYAIHFDASELSSGIYFYHLEVDYSSSEGAPGRNRETRKMVYLK
jgi:hypothetical protein